MSRLSTSTIIRFWLPLAGTWLMMAVEGPYLAAVISRLPNPTENLAAYGVAFAFAVIIESPIIMLLSASTALVRDRRSYVALRKFSYTLNVALTAIIVVAILPPVFVRLADLVRLPAEATDLTRTSLTWLIPWPGFIGYRRFKLGLLISHDRTGLVAVGTVIRLITMSTSALAVWTWTTLPGAEVGAVALSCGVVLEALAAGWMARPIIRDLPDRLDETEPEALTQSGIAAFYFPLAASAVLAMAVQPMVTFFMGASRLALQSLAVLPVINGLTFIFRSLGVSYQAMGIALIGKRGEHFLELRRFATGLGMATSTCLALIAFTPLSTLWFGTISGLSPTLTEFALLPTQILVLLPGLSVLLSFQRALLVNARQTTWITWATLLEVASIAGVILGAIAVFDLPGAVAAAIGLTCGRVLSNSFLLKPCWGVVREYRQVGEVG